MSFTNIVHLNTKTYYSYQHYSLKVPALLVLFIVYTDFGFFLLSKFLPMKVRQRTPLWKAKYRNQTQPYGGGIMLRNLLGELEW
jgi:hypothetical protein